MTKFTYLSPLGGVKTLTVLPSLTLIIVYLPDFGSHVTNPDHGLARGRHGGGEREEPGDEDDVRLASVEVNMKEFELIGYLHQRQCNFW